MPLVTMAMPVANSDIPLSTNPGTAPLETSATVSVINKKIRWFKILQLAFQCITIVFYTLGSHQMTLLAGDSIISAIFGAYVMYSLYNIFDSDNQTDKNKVYLNITFGTIFLIISLILIPLVLMIQDSVLNTNDYAKVIYYIHMKLSSGIFTLILGLSCFAKAMWVTLNNINENLV